MNVMKGQADQKVYRMCSLSLSLSLSLSRECVHSLEKCVL